MFAAVVAGCDDPVAEPDRAGQPDGLGSPVEHRLGADVDGDAADLGEPQLAADLRGGLEHHHLDVGPLPAYRGAAASPAMPAPTTTTRGAGRRCGGGRVATWLTALRKRPRHARNRTGASAASHGAQVDRTRHGSGWWRWHGRRRRRIGRTAAATRGARGVLAAGCSGGGDERRAGRRATRAPAAGATPEHRRAGGRSAAARRRRRRRRSSRLPTGSGGQTATACVEARAGHLAPARSRARADDLDEVRAEIDRLLRRLRRLRRQRADPQRRRGPHEQLDARAPGAVAALRRR